jgi:signal transduction histidine kinase/ligand-binding sensor domain-containing protein
VNYRSRIIRLRSAIVCAVLLRSSCAFALNAALDVSQYVHTTWKVGEGLFKSRITAIAQTSDGYLWFGTELGLLRFDGVRAVPWQPPIDHPLPSSAIERLLAARDGTLWIGTNQGLASWKDGQLVRYDQFAGSVVGTILEDSGGAIWSTRFLNRWTVCRLQSGQVTCEREDGPGADAIGLYEDGRRNLWVGTLNGVWRWGPGPRTFHSVPGEVDGIQGMSEGTDGSLLMSTVGGLRRLVDGRVVMEYAFPPSMRSVEARLLLRDRDGGLWVGTTTSGLVHIHDGITDVFSQVDGLSGNDVSALLEDHEGTIWVATNSGLDRFRESPVVPYSVRQGLSKGTVTSVLAVHDGAVWVGMADGLNRWTNTQVTVYRAGGDRRADVRQPPSSRTVHEVLDAGLTGSIESMLEDRQHRIWLSTSRGVGALEKGRFVTINGIPGGTTRAIVEDASGTIWIANPSVGLFRLPEGRLPAEQISWTVLKHDDVVSAAAADPAGAGLWFGFFRGGIVHFADGQTRTTYSASDGLASGRVSELYTDSSGTLWVAADGGLSRVKNGHVATLTSRNGLPCDPVGWVLEDAEHSLWLGMPCGLVRLGHSEIEAWTAADADGKVPFRRLDTTIFDQADGVRSWVSFSYYTSPAVRASDGKIWFTSPDAVTVVDPNHLPVNTLRPPVFVEQVVANRRIYDLSSAANGVIHLPPLLRDLQIDYTALSLVAPEKARFRYKLEGRDREWQDVGTRRQAFYNDLPPGRYRFRVAASNNSGVWNEAGASLDLLVAPAYYQTSWFFALSVAFILALVWTAHRLRLRIVEKHEHEISALNERLMKAQEQERIRIAGELHDGVMQQMLAATMMLGTAKRKIAGDSAAKETIEKVQDKLVKVGSELRQMSHDLHPPMLHDAGLPHALQAYCDEFSTSSGIPVSCEADENVRELSRGTALALFRIVQEALGNAAKHAGAKRVSVRLGRADGSVALEVSDDGVGIDESRLTTSSSRGLGLVMMRERASQLNGTFELASSPGRGTTIKVVVPFR